jgi:hypothetical protein
MNESKIQLKDLFVPLYREHNIVEVSSGNFHVYTKFGEWKGNATTSIASKKIIDSLYS